MNVQSTLRRSNPRVMCSILAGAMLERFEKKKEPEEFRNVYFDNLIRLLEMYRYDALHSHNPLGVLERLDLPSVDFPSAESGIEVIDAVFHAAHSALYPSLDKEQLVKHLREILEQIRSGTEIVDVEGRTKLREFLCKMQGKEEVRDASS